MSFKLINFLHIPINIYFRLRFGFMNTINAYLRLKISGWDFSLKCALIEFAIPNQSLIYFYLSEIFKLAYKTGFDYKLVYSLSGI